MPVTCKTCNRQFNNIGEVADHISETYQGIQGEFNYESIRGINPNDPKEAQDLLDKTQGFAHMIYVDKNGNLIQDEVYLCPSYLCSNLMKSCFECHKQFPNRYRLAKHILETGHTKEKLVGHWEDAVRTIERLEKLESKYQF